MRELAEQAPGAEDIIRFMCLKGMLTELPGGILLESGHYESIRQKIIDFLKKKGSISIQDMNSLFGFSRKYSIPLLTHLDSEGITRRQENVRVLVKRRESKNH